MKQEYICTMGPKIDDDEILTLLYDRGMRIIRFNMSHIDYDLEKMIERINRLKAKGYNILTMMDTKGPEVRVLVSNNKEVKAGEILTLNKDLKFSCDVSGLQRNDIIKIDDAQIILEVQNNRKFKVLNDGLLKNDAGVYCKRINESLDFLNNKDFEDIKKAFTLKVDWIALSFVRNAADVIKIKDLRDEFKAKTKIMSKVETISALENFEEILDVSDGIMIARGDLGVVMPFELGEISKIIIDRVLKTDKKLVVGTGFLKSMKKNIYPTRAEVNDLYDVFSRGAKSIMFSGESAIAMDPLRVLDVANKIFDSMNNESIARLLK